MSHFTIVRLQNHICSWFINSWFFLIIKAFLADWGVKKIQTKYKSRSLCFVKNWFYSKQFDYFLITKKSTNIFKQRKLCFIWGGWLLIVFFWGGFWRFFLYRFRFEKAELFIWNAYFIIFMLNVTVLYKKFLCLV